MDAAPHQDSELVARMAHGDAEALEHLRARYWRTAYGVAYAVLADSASAVHAVSETFLEAFRSAAGFESTGGSVGAWLAGLARQRALALADVHRVSPSAELTWSLRPPGRRRTAPVLRRT
jgi:RNA polymerase sigma-70 factor (ECF subfamily)